MKLLLRTSRLIEIVSLWRIALDRKTSRVLRINRKRMYFSYLSLLLSCRFPIHSVIIFYFIMFILVFSFSSVSSCPFPHSFPLLFACSRVSSLAFPGESSFCYSGADFSQTYIYEDPWRIMNESSRIAVPTKGTNMIVYHKSLCVCMYACVRGCVHVRVSCLSDVCRLDRIFLDPAF